MKLNTSCAIEVIETRPLAEVLFPDATPYATGRLQVSNLHSLYYEEYGNPQGIPLVVVHGGPGAGTKSEYRHFDLKLFRVILFDQRGAGRSTPYAEVRDNNTQLLIGDLELLRCTLQITRWIVLGGSWGSALALAYAKTHPESVGALILRAFWNASTLTARHILDAVGPHQAFRDSHVEFVALSGLSREDFASEPQFLRALAEFYFSELTCGDEARENEAARRVMVTNKLLGNPNLEVAEDLVDSVNADPRALVSITRTFFWYYLHDFFLTGNPLLEDVKMLRDIPITAVTGLSDFVCPSYQSFGLKEVLPHVKLYTVEGEGHAGFQSGIASVITHAAEEYRTHPRMLAM